MIALLLAVAIAAAPAAAAPAPPLGHQGRWITDAEGRVVILHGWNMVNKLPPYQPSALGFDEDDARFLRDHGFNTVRLGIIYKGLEPEPGRIDERYLDETARTVALLRRHGIFVLLDFHQDMYNERFNGEGLPDWAVQDDGLPAQPDQGFPANYVVMPALSRAYDHFWANDPGPLGLGLQDWFAAAWKRVAERFRGEPSLLGYNLFNEPWPGTVWPTCANPQGCPVFDATLTAFSRRVIAKIREADRESLVWYAPHLIFDFGADSSHGDTGDPNAGFAFNNYCLATIPGFPSFQTGTGCDTLEQYPFTNAERQSEETGDALLMTEFAATDDLAIVERQVNRADANMVSWQQWAYFNEDPCCKRPIEGLIHDPRRPPAGDNVKEGKLEVSARPYPQAVAGTPERFGFDRATRRFELVYSTGRAGGGIFVPGLETEVAVPRLHYREGYRVEVEGAQVVSRPGAQLLRLVACAGARRVNVTVTAGSGVAGRSCRGEVIRLAASPTRSRANRMTTYSFKATASGRPVPGAVVRFAGRSARTDPAGRATIVRRITRAGRHRAVASKPGLEAGTAEVRVVATQARPPARPRRGRPRFTG